MFLPSSTTRIAPSFALSFVSSSFLFLVFLACHRDASSATLASHFFHCVPLPLALFSRSFSLLFTDFSFHFLQEYAFSFTRTNDIISGSNINFVLIIAGKKFISFQYQKNNWKNLVKFCISFFDFHQKTAKLRQRYRVWLTIKLQISFCKQTNTCLKQQACTKKKRNNFSCKLQTPTKLKGSCTV